ncbi:hypothetical protein DERP_013967 [Dermatophagoides pteronyssinus]|uniref:Uncharacterized protein n=1 Tax=Dermatophagoides pteronyssinus TaxID=6956 RepID=A0ABQ8IRN7_DERPT|nr:hypothetical protein DERP_013967 [Dermatophagoides pteronyssinus]
MRIVSLVKSPEKKRFQITINLSPPPPPPPPTRFIILVKFSVVFTNNEDYLLDLRDSSIISGAGNGSCGDDDEDDCGKFSTTLLSSFVE